MLDYLNFENPVSFLSNHLTRLVKGRLWLKVLIGMFLGVAAKLMNQWMVRSDILEAATADASVPLKG